MNILSSLRYLVALNEHGHFGRAAQACHITQPALSNAIRALEQEYGVVIVKRGRTYGGLTAEGVQVLAAAQRMLHEHGVLTQELAGQAGRPGGPLRVGAVPTAMPVVARFVAILRSRHPAIVPTVLSMSSPELEAGLENMSLDLGLGYTQRTQARGTRFTAMPQYAEHYFLLRRAAQPSANGLRIGDRIAWKDVAGLPLVLLTPDMHNRSVIDGAFSAAGVPIRPAIETNSILTLALSVVAGDVCSVMPGAVVDAVRGYRELEALPLIQPEVSTPVGFMLPASVRPSRALEAALALAQDGAWLRQAAAHAGLLSA